MYRGGEGDDVGLGRVIRVFRFGDGKEGKGKMESGELNKHGRCCVVAVAVIVVIIMKLMMLSIIVFIHNLEPICMRNVRERMNQR